MALLALNTFAGRKPSTLQTPQIVLNNHQRVAQRFSSHSAAKKIVMRHSSSPVFEQETRDVAKFFGVGSNQRQIENEGVAGNQQIVRTERCS